MKKTLIELSILAVGLLVLGGLLYTKKTEDKKSLLVCPVDVMMCPDGSSVPRSGPNCEFGICKQGSLDMPEDISKSSEVLPPITPFTNILLETTKKVPSSKSQPAENSIIRRITVSASSLVKDVTNSLESNISSGLQETKNPQPSPAVTPNVVIPPVNKPSLDETRYTVVSNTIVDQNNTVIYTFPTSTPYGSDTSGWTTTVVNVVPVNQVPPVINGIPVQGLPGKYYLSENSFGNTGSCEFSNKIYILDTATNDMVLIYEENNSTLPSDDFRACSSEIFLLATENENLILKYHTIGTNMVCESTWSEPDKTWYLDVTKLNQGTKRYIISPTLYTEAEESESTCRQNLEATTTP